MKARLFFGESIRNEDWPVILQAMIPAMKLFATNSPEMVVRERIRNRVVQMQTSLDKLPSTGSGAARQLLNEIKRQRAITTHQAQVFVLSSGRGNANLEKLKGLILYCAFEHQNLFGSNARIQRAMSAWRLLASDASAENARIMTLLPDVSLPLGRIVRRLNTVIDDPDQEFAHARLLPIRRLLEDVHEREFIKKRSVIPAVQQGDQLKNEKPAAPKENRHPVLAPDLPKQLPPEAIHFEHHTLEGDEDIPAGVEFSATPQSDAEQQDPIEHDVDHRPSRTYLAIETPKTAPVWVAQSAALSAMQARNAINQIERREKKLATSWSGLTRHEVTTLVTALRSGDESSESVRAALAVMFLAGRRFEQFAAGVRASRMTTDKQRRDECSWQQSVWQWRFLPDLPRHALATKFQKLVDAQNESVVLTLADLGFAPLANLTADIELKLKEQIDSWLVALNQRLGTRLTLNRICDYLGYFLHHLGHDDVVISLLTGDADFQQAGIFYFQYDIHELQAIHAEFVKKLFGVTLPKDSHGRGGSQLVVKPQVVAAVLEHQRMMVEKARSKKNLVEFHNAFVVQVITLLNLATGHRPVKDPFDDIDSFDLVGRKVFISDKEIRSGDALRILVLPNLMVEQLRHYLDHMSAVEAVLFWSDPDVAASIRASLDAEAPLFFLLREEDGIQRMSVRPKSVHEHVSPYFDLPLNWHRHYLRTNLSRWGIPGEQIDTFMGHARPGQEGLALFSGMSMAALRDVAERLDEHFHELNVTCIQGWGRHG